MTLKETYFQWLLDTGQEETAGELREREGDYLGAVNLYMKGGLATRAAKLMATHSVRHLTSHDVILHHVMS